VVSVQTPRVALEEEQELEAAAEGEEGEEGAGESGSDEEPSED
jgi:hypothetical protein